MITAIKNLNVKLDLIKQLLKRDILIRYKGSLLGFLWAIIQPIIMLSVYTFVFSVIFQAKWGISESTSKSEYALLLFVGLIFFNIFSDVINRSPGLIVANSSYVTKVVFPTEILSIVALGNALVHSLISFVVLIVAKYIITGDFYWTSLYLIPFIYLSVGLLTLGISWILSSLGVFLRDLNYLIGIIVQVLFFMTPIFYPVTSVPEEFQFVMQLNPLTGVIENARNIILFGEMPNWEWYFSSLFMSLIIAIFGYIWFNKTKKAFADVL